MFFNLLDTTASTGGNGASGGNSLWLMLVYLVVIGGAMYLFIFRPQKKKQKNEEKMRNDIQIGDEIVTIGGFVVRVVSIKDDGFIVESVADHTKQKISKWSIQANNTVHDN